MRVAAVQMVSGKNLESNLAAAAELIRSAAEQHAQVVVLPENFACFGGSQITELGRGEATSEGPIRRFLREQASFYDIFLVGGSLPTVDADQSGAVPPDSKVFTCSIVCGPDGSELGRYDKMHLFDVDVADAQGSYRESDQFAPGSAPQVVNTAGVNLGLSICYDLRFPEYYRALLDLGAQIITVPAAFTYVTGEAHWEVLLRARAIENQCFVIAANQGGQNTPNRKTWGQSCIISPWGEILAQLPQGEGVVVADLDFESLNKIRRDMPALQHRRL